MSIMAALEQLVGVLYVKLGELSNFVGEGVTQLMDILAK